MVMHFFRSMVAIWARCLFFVAGVTGFPNTSPAGTLLIQGQVVDTNGNPLDGCLVSIAQASPTQQRSRGVLTEGGGKFEVAFASNYSPSNQQTSSYPYLEIYWDETLIFRQPLPSLRIERGNQASNASGWIYYLVAGGQVILSPIRVSR